VFWCSSTVVVEDACVRDCRGLGVCMVDTIGYSVGGECVQGRSNVMTVWGRQRGGREDRGRE
jgi:hypothetical protein